MNARLTFPRSVVLLGLLAAWPTLAAANPCDSATDRAQISAEGEPGTPMVVRGQVLLPDGTTPAAGVILYVYHTDVGGLYSRPGEPRDPPRLRAWLRTDREGRYEYRTIRPGSYPGTRIQAHVHTQIWGPGVPFQYGPDLHFNDDPFVGDAERRESEAAGRFASVAKPVTESGVLMIRHDIRLSPDAEQLEGNTSHGFDACR